MNIKASFTLSFLVTHATNGFTTPSFHIPKIHSESYKPTFPKTAEHKVLKAVSSSSEYLSNDAVIVGGGPAGLLCAIMLAQKDPNYQVEVFDRLGPPPSPTDDAVWCDVAKFYLIGTYCSPSLLVK